MPFRGGSPYGTDSGTDNLTLPQSPADVRIAVNGTHIAYLVVNGPISVRNREQIEQIVRILNRRGMEEGTPIAVAIIVRDNGAVVETDAADIDFTDGILVEYVSPGVIRVKIPAGGITGSMIADQTIDSSKITPSTIGSSRLADGGVIRSKLANGVVDTSKIADGSVTPAKLDRTYLTGIPAAHSHDYDGAPLFLYSHRTTAIVALRVSPSYDASVIMSLPVSSIVSDSGFPAITSGGDPWRYVYARNAGFGWLPWHSMTTY